MSKKSHKNFHENISKMSFEEAMERLENIVETLSSQKVNLDSMVELYEEGNALKEYCAKRLDEAKMKVEIIGKKDAA